MRGAVVAFGALFVAGAALGQAGPELGRTSPVHGGANESLGARSGMSRLYDANGHMSEKDYRAALAGRIAQAQAQALAGQALAGEALTDRDRGKIRGAIRSDLIAWRKQYDPRRADYQAMRDRWLVDEAALSAQGWAKQRLDWLRAQQQWILANYGEIDARQQAIRAR